MITSCAAVKVNGMKPSLSAQRRIQREPAKQNHHTGSLGYFVPSLGKTKYPLWGEELSSW